MSLINESCPTLIVWKSDNTFYFLEPEYTPKRHARGWFRKDGPSNVANKSTTSVVEAAQEVIKAPTIRITMSKSIIVDFDPQDKSSILQLAQIHLDVVHHARSCFHFEVNWLGSAQGVEEFIRSASRSIERYGIRMIEGPVLTPLGP